MLLINHLESNLGTISQGGQLKDKRFHLSANIFNNQPFTGVTSISTLGLSRYPLEFNNKTFFMELILGFEDYFDKIELSKFLLVFCRKCYCKWQSTL